MKILTNRQKKELTALLGDEPFLIHDAGPNISAVINSEYLLPSVDTQLLRHASGLTNGFLKNVYFEAFDVSIIRRLGNNTIIFRNDIIINKPILYNEGWMGEGNDEDDIESEKERITLTSKKEVVDYLTNIVQFEKQFRRHQNSHEILLKSRVSTNHIVAVIVNNISITENLIMELSKKNKTEQNKNLMLMYKKSLKKQQKIIDICNERNISIIYTK